MPNYCFFPPAIPPLPSTCFTFAHRGFKGQILTQRRGNLPINWFWAGPELLSFVPSAFSSPFPPPGGHHPPRQRVPSTWPCSGGPRTLVTSLYFTVPQNPLQSLPCWDVPLSPGAGGGFPFKCSRKGAWPHVGLLLSPFSFLFFSFCFSNMSGLTVGVAASSRGRRLALLAGRYWCKLGLNFVCRL